MVTAEPAAEGSDVVAAVVGAAVAAVAEEKVELSGGGPVGLADGPIGRFAGLETLVGPAEAVEFGAPAESAGSGGSVGPVASLAEHVGLAVLVGDAAVPGAAFAVGEAEPEAGADEVTGAACAVGAEGHAVGVGN